MSVNKVILIGHVGKEPEIKRFANGNSAANFSLATTEKWTKDGEKKERTEWHKIAVNGPLVKVVESYVHKGSHLYIEGAVRTRKWAGQDGVDHYVTEVVIGGVNSSLPNPGGQPQGELEPVADGEEAPF